MTAEPMALKLVHMLSMGMPGLHADRHEARHLSSVRYSTLGTDSCSLQANKAVGSTTIMCFDSMGIGFVVHAGLQSHKHPLCCRPFTLPCQAPSFTSHSHVPHMAGTFPLLVKRTIFPVRQVYMSRMRPHSYQLLCPPLSALAGEAFDLSRAAGVHELKHPTFMSHPPSLPCQPSLTCPTWAGSYRRW
jgi:hypothetical protein